MKDQFQMHS